MLKRHLKVLVCSHLLLEDKYQINRSWTWCTCAVSSNLIFSLILFHPEVLITVAFIWRVWREISRADLRSELNSTNTDMFILLQKPMIFVWKCDYANVLFKYTIVDVLIHVSWNGMILQVLLCVCERVSCCVCLFGCFCPWSVSLTSHEYETSGLCAVRIMTNRHLHSCS